MFYLKYQQGREVKSILKNIDFCERINNSYILNHNWQGNVRELREFKSKIETLRQS